MIISLVVGGITARYLGRGGFGLLSFTLSYIALFRIVASLGLEEVLVRELVRFPDNRNELLGTALALRLISGVAAIIAVVISVQFLHQEDPQTRLLVIIASFVYIPQAGMVAEKWFSAQLQAKLNMISGNVALMMFAVARLVMVYYHAPLIWFVWSNVAVIAVNAITSTALYVPYYGSFTSWRVSWSLAMKLVRHSWPKIPEGFASAAQSQLGALIIGLSLGVAELGSYAAAFRFYGMLLIVPSIIAQSLAPTLTRAREAGSEQFDQRLTQAYRLSFLAYLATLILVIPLGPFGVRLVYGPQYAEAGHLVLWMSIPLLLVYLGQVRMWCLMIDHQLHYAMYSSFANVAVTIVANFMLIKYVGLLGAVAALAFAPLAAFITDAFFVPGRRSTRALFKALTFQ